MISMITPHASSQVETGAEKPALLSSPVKAWCLLLLVFVAVHFAALFSPAILDDADATHANAAQHMAISGDWVTLRVNGIRYLEKPPLPYWLVAVDYHLFGYNVFATHLPVSLAVLACAVLAWTWSRRAWGDRAAFYAALAILTSIGIFLFTRFLIPESLLTFFLGLALYAFLTGLEDRKPERLLSRLRSAGHRRARQRTHRSRLLHRRRRSLAADHRRMAALASTAALHRHPALPRDRRALAHPRRSA